MQIEALIYRDPQGKLSIYEPEDLTPEAFQLIGSTELGGLMLLDGRHYTEMTRIDYSRICTDHEEVAKLTTWETVEKLLTDNDELRIGYSWNDITTKRVNIPFSDVHVWDVMHTLKTFNIEYGDVKSDVNNIFALRWKLLDLRLTLMEDAEETPNLETSIPVVNGFICAPVLRNREGEDVLYARLGAQLCWQSGIHRTPEVQILDFKSFGGFTIHPFVFSVPDKEETPTDSTDTCSFINRTKEFDLNARWKILTRLSLKEYTPIVVLGGIPVFPDQIELQHEHCFVIQPNLTPLNYALAYKAYLKDKYVEARNAWSSISLQQYFSGEHLAASSFIIYLKSSQVYTNREHMDVWSNYITVNNHTPDGILISDITGTLAAYNREELSDRTELTLQNQESLFIADKNFIEKQFAFVPPDCVHHQQSHTNLRESSCTMVYLMRGSR